MHWVLVTFQLSNVFPLYSKSHDWNINLPDTVWGNMISFLQPKKCNKVVKEQSVQENIREEIS